MDGYNLVGRIRPVYRGVWNAETAYTVLETVTTADNSAAYIAVKDVPAGIPLSNDEYWGLLVDVGGLEGAGGGSLTDGSVLAEHIAAETWDEIDSRINAALGVIENGAY